MPWRRRIAPRARLGILWLVCAAAPVAPATVDAAPAGDWGLERDTRDPALIARRFETLRKKPFDGTQWRALERALGRAQLANKIAATLARHRGDVALTILDAKMKLLRGKPKAAAEQLAAVEDRAKRWRGQVFELRMRALEAAGAHQELVTSLERAAASAPSKSRASLLRRAYKHADRGGLDKAQVRIAGKLAEASPGSLDARRRLALAASRVGDNDTAEAAFRAAEKLTKGRRQRLDLRLDWANARARAGDVDGATTLLWTSLDQGSSPGERALLWEHLESIYRGAGSEDAFVEQLAAWLQRPANKRDAAAWRALAAAQSRTGVDPLPAWRTAARLDPKDPDTRKALILALDADGRASEALDEFRNLSRRPEYVELGLELANRMIPNGERDLAMALGAELESMAGRDAQALMLLINFYNLNDEPERALKTARQLVKAHPRDPEARIILGEQLFQMRDQKAATREWAMLPKLIRPRHKGWARHAEILSEHNMREAKDSLQKALASAPREPNYLRLQALIQTEQRVYTDALKTWQKLLSEAKGPQNQLLRDEARSRIVQLLVQATSSQMVRARDDAERDAIKTLSPPDEPEAALEAGLFLAELYTREEKFRNAVIVHEKLVAMDPNNPERLAALALSQRRAEMPDEAMATLDRLMAADPKRGADLLSELSDMAFESGEIERVLKVAAEAKAQGVDSSSALLRLGELYERRGDTDAAARTYEGLLKARPDDAAAMLHLAELRLTRGELEDAAKLFKKILRVPAPPEITRKAFRRSLDLAEARDQLFEIVDLALQSSKRSAGSTDSLEFLLDALDRTQAPELRGWLGLPKKPGAATQTSRGVARSRLNALRQALLQALARGPVGARQRAAEHLGRLALPETAAPLARIGAHLSPPRNATRAVQGAYVRARATALQAAGELDDPDAIVVFKELLRSPERFSEVRYAAAWALARNSSPRAAEALKPFVSSRDDSVMASLACIALARPGNEATAREHASEIARLAERARNPYARHACTYASAALRAADDLEPVIDELDNSDPVVASIAAWRLGNIQRLPNAKTRVVVGALLKRFIGPKGLARDAAGASLARLLRANDDTAKRAIHDHDAAQTLPPLARANNGVWETAIERWIRALVAPRYDAINASQLKPFMPELEQALAAAADGTRAEQQTAADIQAGCREVRRSSSPSPDAGSSARAASGPRCLAPLIDGPIQLRSLSR